MFEKFKQNLKRGLNSMNGNTLIPTIWEVRNVPAFRDFWLFSMLPAKYVYQGYYEPWHTVSEPNALNQNKTRQLKRLNTAKTICETIGGYVWNDRCQINVTAKSGDENNELGKFINKVLTDNNFEGKFPDFYESVLALGGGAIKAWCDVARNEDSSEAINGDEELQHTVYNVSGERIGSGNVKFNLDFHKGDQFVPTSWNNKEINMAIFLSRELKDGWYYTRVEWHQKHGDKYEIHNSVFRIKKDDAVTLSSQLGIDSQVILGYEYPLDKAYETIDPHVCIDRVKHSLFAYFKTAGANNIDENSPLGISCYGNAMDVLHSVDEAYDTLCREVTLSKKRLIVPARALEPVPIKTIDPTGKIKTKMGTMYNSDDSVITALNIDDTENLKVFDNSLNMRIVECKDALNTQLSLLCEVMGLDAGLLSFEYGKGLKTATEVISENSKTFSTIGRYQNQLRASLKSLIDNIIEIAELYEVSYNGKMVSDLVKDGYEVSVSLDDGIVEDVDTTVNRGVVLVGAGLMSKKRFLTKVLKMTETEAEQEIKRIAEEAKIDANGIDFFGNGEETRIIGLD